MFNFIFHSKLTNSTLFHLFIINYNKIIIYLNMKYLKKTRFIHLYTKMIYVRLIKKNGQDPPATYCGFFADCCNTQQC